MFDFVILRVIEKRLGWLKTCFIYILSGVGGNVVSAVFVPYYPEVRLPSCSKHAILWVEYFAVHICCCPDS